jgi:two-component system sensor histidine kinase QseC
VALHSYFSREAQLQILDKQVRDVALDLIDSDLNNLKNLKSEKVESIISDDLGEDRIGKIFIIRDRGGRIVYKSQDTKFLPSLQVPTQPEWLSYYNLDNYIRILNTQMPKLPGHILQVGIVTEDDLLGSQTLAANAQLAAAVLLLGLLTSWVLSSVLLQPIHVLVEYLSTVAKDPMDRFSLPSLPYLLASIRRKRSQADEMNQLLDSFESLIHRVQKMHQNSVAWSYQMAHELKTPIAIVGAQVSQGNVDPEIRQAIERELTGMSELVGSFLDLAELSGSSTQKNLRANRLSAIVSGISARLGEKYPGRLRVQVEEDFFVLCDRRFLERSVINLILNALEYSAEDVNVVVRLPGIEISDRGPGVPSPVLNRLGEPFNKQFLPRSSPQTRSHGLGLAYVYTICRIYDWQLSLTPQLPGTLASIQFPHDQVESVSSQSS